MNITEILNKFETQLRTENKKLRIEYSKKQNNKEN
jgi:hypothetical protein